MYEPTNPPTYLPGLASSITVIENKTWESPAVND